MTDAEQVTYLKEENRLLKGELERSERTRASQRAAMMDARNDPTCTGMVKRKLDAALGILEHGSCAHL